MFHQLGQAVWKVIILLETTENFTVDIVNYSDRQAAQRYMEALS